MSNISEEHRRDLAAMFLSKGWQFLKTELDERAKLRARQIIFGQNRETDDENRGFIKAIDSIISIERGIFAASPEIEAPAQPRPSSTDRYDVGNVE